MNNRPPVLFIILDTFIFLAFLSMVSAVVLWIWAGWYYGWRMGLTGIIAAPGFILLKKFYHTLHYAQHSRQKTP